MSYMQLKQPYSELSEPKRRIIRSDAALFVLLLLGAIGCIALSHYLSDRFGVLRIIFQLSLYGVLLAGGYLIYRFRIVSYRYTLSDSQFLVTQVVGNRTKDLFTVPIEAIVSVGVDEHAISEGRTYVGSRKNTFAVTYRKDGELRTLFLSGSDRLRELIEEQIHDGR